MVVELGAEVRAWGTYPGGQSGNPASPRYLDRMALWREGQLDTLFMPRDTSAFGRSVRATAARPSTWRAGRSPVSRALRIVVGAAVVALGTWFGGWLAPAVWGALVGAALPHGRSARRAAVDAALGWAAILVLLAVRGDPVGTLAVRLGGAMGVPVVGLVAATLAFPALLASCAAWLAAQIPTPRRRDSRGDKSPAMIMHEAA